MNLEHTRVIPATGIERKSNAEMLVEKVEKENLLRRAVSRLAKVGETAWLAKEMDAAHEYSIALAAVVRDYNEAKRWADHYRNAVRQELRHAHCANDDMSEVQA